MVDGDGMIVVLHVDDDPAFADLTAKFLQREDACFNVKTEIHAQEALEYFQTEDVDCILSDYDLPDLDGLEFL